MARHSAATADPPTDPSGEPDFFGTIAHGGELDQAGVPRLPFVSRLARWGVTVSDAQVAAFVESGLGADHHLASASRRDYDAWAERRLGDWLGELGVERERRTALVAELRRPQGQLMAYPEAYDVLASLRERGVRVGVCSNWSWDLERHVVEAGLGPVVDEIVSSAQAGYRKPSPEIYRIALDALAVTAGDAAFVGDSWLTDVEGPLAAGFALAVHVDRCGDGGPAVLPPHTARVRDLRALPAVLASGHAPTNGHVGGPAQ